MRLFADEIDQDLVEKKVPLRDAAKAPAFMEAISGRAKLRKLVGLGGGQLSGFDEFLQFGIHDGTNKLQRRLRFASGNCSIPPLAVALAAGLKPRPPKRLGSAARA